MADFRYRRRRERKSIQSLVEIPNPKNSCMVFLVKPWALRHAITLPETWGKFAMLDAQQKALKSRASRCDLLIEYLQGISQAFAPERISENELLSEIADFEGKLKILRTLNSLITYESDPFIPRPTRVANEVDFGELKETVDQKNTAKPKKIRKI
jgi:hypothetical protein